MQTNTASTASRNGEREGDRYELLGELATGGMATVYLSRMRRPMGFNRLVAIKCMHPQYAKDPSFASMFVDEARLTARLRHPNIVPTLDIVSDDGQLLIVMEYVEGESLAGLLKLVRDAGDRIPVAVACAIIHDLLLGLHEAHESTDDDGSALAIIHRDVSPQNVMVGLDGLARVLDFGVAKARRRVHHSNAGEIKGKIPYMPPEQLFGEGVDRRVDIYAAGVLLWESLVGQRLFEGSNEEALVRRIDAGDVPAPSTKIAGISPELDAIAMRALCKNAEGRFPTALAMAEAISGLVALPPRTEISSWIKRFASPRAVPANAIGCSRDLTEGMSPDAIVAVLEHRATIASRRRPVTRAARGPLTLAPVSIGRAPAAVVPGTSRLTMVLGIAAFALAGVLVGRTMRADVAHADTAHHAAAVAPTVETAHAVAPTSAAQAPVAEPVAVAAPLAKAAKAVATKPGRGPAKPAAKSAPAAAVAPSEPAAEVAAPVATVAPAAAPVAASVAAATAKPASCRLPYVVDAEGHRHYKVECL
jgi:serine/threonine protein kinase